MFKKPVTKEFTQVALFVTLFLCCQVHISFTQPQFSKPVPLLEIEQGHASPPLIPLQHGQKTNVAKPLLIGVVAGSLLGILVWGFGHEGHELDESTLYYAAIGGAAGTLVGLSVVILNSESPPSRIEGGVAGGMLGLAPEPWSVQG